MRRSSPILSVVRTLRAGAIVAFLLACLAPGVCQAQESAVGTPAASSRLDEVFKSLQDNTRGQPMDVAWKPLLLGGAGLALMVFAIRHWNQHQSRPKVQALHNHRKLLKQASKAAGLSPSQLKAVTPVTQANGLSSPLVALLCPSTIKKLAQSAKTPEQQEAFKVLAKTLVRRELKQGAGAR